MKKETRNFNVSLDNDSRILSGYAAVFNSESKDLGGFTEMISPTAFEGVIERSDVFAVLDHDRNKVLARSKMGKGSLELNIDEKGLQFRFEAPETTLGNDVLSMVKRGDLTDASFCFTVEDESWQKREDGSYLRTINKIGDLFDVAICYNGAYAESYTEVALRSLDKFKEEELRAAKEVEEEDSDDVDETNDKTTEETNDKTSEETNEVDVDETPDKTENEQETDINKDGSEEEEPEDKEKEKDKQKNRHMENFSIVKSIRSVVDNRPMDEVNQNVLNAGRKEMRDAGISFGGQIQLPLEYREEPGPSPSPSVTVNQAGVENYGKELIQTDKFSLMEPLTNKLVFTELGATYLNVTNNVSVPKMSALNAGWVGEIEDAANTTATFETVDYTPKRISAYIDISKTLLYQDGTGVENMIRNQIVEALAQVLESTVLGKEAETNKKPAGIFNAAGAKDLTFGGLVAMEKALEEANVNGEFKYLVNPAIKATLRQTAVGGSKSDFRMLLDSDNEINGIPVVCTNNAKGIAVADWSNLWITTFGGVDIVVDTVSQAVKNCIRIVVSMNVDAKFVRDEAVVAKV